MNLTGRSKLVVECCQPPFVAEGAEGQRVTQGAGKHHDSKRFQKRLPGEESERYEVVIRDQNDQDDKSDPNDPKVSVDPERTDYDVAEYDTHPEDDQR